MSDVAATAPSGGRKIPGPGPAGLVRFVRKLLECPHDAMLETALEYGDIFILNYVTERVVFLVKPEYIEHVLHHRHQYYDKNTMRWTSVRQVWGDGLLTSNGSVWRRQRQRMQPAFHQDALENFAGILAEEARRVSGLWADAAARGEPRDVYPDMLSCAMRTITRAAFGSDIEGKTDLINSALEDVQDYINPMSVLNLLSVPIKLQHLINPEYRRFRRAFDSINAILRGIVTRRVADGRTEADLLGLLMHGRDEEHGEAMTAEQLQDEMVNILMAGHETTGIATAWAWYWLSRCPDVQRRLHEELDRVLGDRLPTAQDLPNLPYTKLVFQEAMRINPPVWGFDRRARQDEEIDGYRIRQGTVVAISPWVLHHHPKYWKDPDTFRPERFDAAESAGRPAYAYFPFGGGPRRCIGMRFAMLEGQLILATLAQAFSVRLRPGHRVVPEPRLNMPPKFGVQMLFERRRVAVGSGAAPSEPVS